MFFLNLKQSNPYCYIMLIMQWKKNVINTPNCKKRHEKKKKKKVIKHKLFGTWCICKIPRPVFFPVTWCSWLYNANKYRIGLEGCAFLSLHWCNVTPLYKDRLFNVSSRLQSIFCSVCRVMLSMMFGEYSSLAVIIMIIRPWLPVHKLSWSVSVMHNFKWKDYKLSLPVKQD